MHIVRSVVAHHARTPSVRRFVIPSEAEDPSRSAGGPLLASARRMNLAQHVRSSTLSLIAAATIAACAGGGGDDSSALPAGQDAGPGGGDAASPLDSGKGKGPCGALGQACCSNSAPCLGTLICTLGVCAAPSPDAGGDDASGDDGSTPCNGMGEAVCNGQCVFTDSDPQNCGACGHDCQGASCTGGACTPQVMSMQFTPPGRLAIDTTNLYWTNGDGTVRAAPLAGGATTTLGQGLSQPMGIAVDANAAYVASRDGRVVAVALDGSQTITTLASSQPNPYAVAVDGTNVYWSNVATGAGNGSLMACAKGGCNSMPTTLSSGIHLQYPYGVVSDGTYVYWTSFNFGGEVNRVPVGGGNFDTLATNTGYPYEISVASQTILVVEYGFPGVVATVPQGGEGDGGSPTNIAAGLALPTEGTTDGTTAYFTLNEPDPKTGATLYGCALKGCNFQPQVLAKGVQPAGAVVTDAKWVYWLSNDGTVLKTPK